MNIPEVVYVEFRIDTTKEGGKTQREQIFEGLSTWVTLVA